jgi:hypothetical protein
VRLSTLLQEIPVFSRCVQDDAEAWLNNDAVDPGYEVLSGRYHLQTMS